MKITASRILQITVCLFAPTLTATAATQPRGPSALPSWVQQAELTASDGTEFDSFGITVAISGATLVVGAPSHPFSRITGDGPGAAYVFTNSSRGWAQVAELTPSDGVNGGFFGGSVCISGDTIVVGADARGAFNKFGAAYVYVKPATGWKNATETARLTASDEALSDFFGTSVAISNDTIVVGASRHQIAGNQAQGAAYVFVKPASGWTTLTQTAELTASDGAQQDELGFSVAIQGNTVVAGASEATLSSFFGAGAAYVFVRPSGGWANSQETGKLTATDPNFLASFGDSVALDAAGTTVVVGAPRRQVNSGPQGAAYIFVEPASGWASMTQSAELLAPGPALLFGFVSVNDKGTTVVVGAPATSSNAGVNLGAAYIYLRPASGWAPTPQANAKLTSSAEQQNGYFGRSVAVQGLKVVVGEYGATVNGNTSQGAAFVFHHQ